MNSFAQRTFETFLNITKIHSVEQNPDGSYILSFDSVGAGVMKLDACGSRTWSTSPVFRTSSEVLYDVAPDPYTGGYIAGGSSPDTTGTFTAEPFIIQLDANGLVTNSRLLTGGAISGNTASVRATPDSGYVLSIFKESSGATNSSDFKKIDLMLADDWNFQGLGSQVSSASVDINANTDYLFSAYNALASSSPAVRQFDIAGVLQNTFVVPDTFQGGSSFFNNAIVGHTLSGDYVVGSTLSPIGGTTNYPYIIMLDDALNVQWQKIFNWGNNAQVLSVLSGPGNGLMCMINQRDTLLFLHLNSNGDSLWTKTYAGLGTVKPNTMRPCADGGFLISGSTTDGLNNFGFILKLDSLAQLLPSVCIQNSGANTICPGSTITLLADSGYQYLWSTSETNQSIVVDTIGNYFVTVTDSASGLSAQSESIQVSFYTTSIPVINMLGTLLVSTPAVSYQWLLSGDTIPGQTGSDISPTIAGDYSVRIEDANGCVSTSAPFSYIMPGIRELESASVFQVQRINRDFLELSIQSNENGKVNLYDLRGVLVRKINVNAGEGNTLNITVSDLATGVYSLLWTSEKYVQSAKILIGY